MNKNALKLKKEIDIDMLDILDSPENSAIPFRDAKWIGSGDYLVTEFSKLFTSQLPFIHRIVKELPTLIPHNKRNPGTIEQLLFQHIMEFLYRRQNREKDTEAKVMELWLQTGGSERLYYTVLEQETKLNG